MSQCFRPVWKLLSDIRNALRNIENERNIKGHVERMYSKLWLRAAKHYSWWRHQRETFSALLALCAGNSPINGEFPTQMPVTRSFGVLFVLQLNKRLSKQVWGWWFDTPLRSLCRRCNVGTGHLGPLETVMTSSAPKICWGSSGLIKYPPPMSYIPWWRHQIKTFSALLAICAGNHRSPVNSGTKASDAELWGFLWSAPE